jgi:hypothetical protein
MIDKSSHGLWKSQAFRQLRIVNADWNNNDLPRQCAADLQTNPVFWLIEPTLPITIFRIQPVRADHRDKDLALGKLLVKNDWEVCASMDINVHKHAATTKLPFEKLRNADSF